MNVPMYLRDEEREMDRLMEEKEERWRREGLMGQQTGQQTALEIEARRQQALQKQPSTLLGTPDQIAKMQKILQEKNDEKAWQEAMRGQGIYSSAISGNHTVAGLGLSLSGKIGVQTPLPPPDPNNIPEMQMSLEVAYNMWLVRFGDMWVKSEDVQDADGFRWPLVASRLRDMRLLEVTTVSNHYRLVPHVWT